MTLTELLAQLERRALEADAIGASAPAGNIYRQILEELRPLAGEQNGPLARGVTQEHWLTATEVAKRLHTSARWVYDHAEQLGAKRLSRRCVRIPPAGLRRYLERRR